MRVRRGAGRFSREVAVLIAHQRMLTVGRPTMVDVNSDVVAFRGPNSKLRSVMRNWSGTQPTIRLYTLANQFEPATAFQDTTGSLAASDEQTVSPARFAMLLVRSLYHAMICVRHDDRTMARRERGQIVSRVPRENDRIRAQP